MSILEHWNNVFHLFSHWSRPIYFFPDKHALAYNDGYLIYGAIFTLFRVAGIDPFLSGELVNATVRGIGFFAFYAAGQRILRLEWRWSLFAAGLFTICNNAYIHAVHQQLLSVSFAPALAVLLHQAHGALLEGRRRALLIFGGTFLFAYAAWLLTSFYMAWYFGLFTAVFTLAWITLAGHQRRGRLIQALWRHRAPLLLLALAGGLFLLPFLKLYLPKAEQTGGHSFEVTQEFIPSPLDAIDVGEGNALYGALDFALREYFYPGGSHFTERTTGFPPLLLILLVLSILSVLRGRPNSRETVTLRALALTSLVTWFFMMRIGSFTAYGLIFDWIPGATAIRVVSRYQIFLGAPIVALAIFYLARHSGRLPALLVGGICVLLIGEEINTAPVMRINRPAELARLHDLPAAPAECRAFYVTKIRPGFDNDSIIGRIYRPSVDAMLVAEIRRLPTVNGYASFIPPDYDLLEVDRRNYLERVRRYAEQNHIQGLCGIDMSTMTWSRPEGG